MSLIAPLRPGKQSRRRLAFALAVALPVLGMVLAAPLSLLHGTPNSANVLAVVVVGLLGGLAPSMVSIGVAEATRIVYLLLNRDQGVFFSQELLHLLVLLATAFVVWFMNRQRR
ncbi:MAG: hypothetical protein WB439_05360, partial [Acidobacteriaceae bacterium]